METSVRSVTTHRTDEPSGVQFFEQFPLYSFPFKTELYDAESLQGLPPHEIPEGKLPDESSIADSIEYFYFARLSTKQDIRVLVVATLQQESEGLLLTLITYNNEGKPIADFDLKTDISSGDLYYIRDSEIDAALEIRVTELEVSGQYVGEEFKKTSSSKRISRYGVQNDGTIRLISGPGIHSPSTEPPEDGTESETI